MKFNDDDMGKVRRRSYTTCETARQHVRQSDRVFLLMVIMEVLASAR